MSLRGFLRSQEQAGDLAKSVEAATAATQLGVQQYRTGTIDFNRVFNLETTQVQQQDNLAVAAGNIALNLINVYRALGGGWEFRLHHDPLVAPASATAPLPHAASVAPPPSATVAGRVTPITAPAGEGPRAAPATPAASLPVALFDR